MESDASDWGLAQTARFRSRLTAWQGLVMMKARELATEIAKYWKIGLVYKEEDKEWLELQ